MGQQPTGMSRGEMLAGDQRPVGGRASTGEPRRPSAASGRHVAFLGRRAD
jgi:hypothetical protein